MPGLVLLITTNINSNRNDKGYIKSTNIKVYKMSHVSVYLRVKVMYLFKYKYQTFNRLVERQGVSD